MKYILIKKDIKNEEFRLFDIVKDFLQNNYNVDKDEGIIEFGTSNTELNYSIWQNSDADRCILCVNSKQRISNTAKYIEEFNNKLDGIEYKKYFYLLKAYDGLSEYYCEKLYPRYAYYERRLRYMVLLMVTKAYGGMWIKNTFNKDLVDSVTQTGRKSISKMSLETPLEYFELQQLEDYLFLSPVTDMNRFVDEELTRQKLEQLDKEDVYNLIEKAKNPPCLWERVFSNIGNKKKWQEAMGDVHNNRNSVAHHKTVSSEEYKKTVKQLKCIDTMIEEAIETILTKELENTKMVDVLGTFALFAGKSLIEQFNYSLLKDMVVAFSRRMQELIKPIESNVQKNTLEAIRECMLNYSSFNIENGYVEAMKNLANSMTIYEEQVSKSFDAIGSTLKQYQIDAIGTAAKFENLAKQMSSFSLSENKDDV